MWDGAILESQNRYKQMGSGALAEVRERDNDVAVKGAGSGDRTK